MIRLEQAGYTSSPAYASLQAKVARWPELHQAETGQRLRKARYLLAELRAAEDKERIQTWKTRVRKSTAEVFPMAQTSAHGAFF